MRMLQMLWVSRTDLICRTCWNSWVEAANDKRIGKMQRAWMAEMMMMQESLARSLEMFICAQGKLILKEAFSLIKVLNFKKFWK